MSMPNIAELLEEYERALAYTDDLWTDLTDEEICWRASVNSSAIGWHLGHQAAVSHFMIRNLTAAEPPIDARLDALMDSATPEPARGELPDRATLAEFRTEAADRLRFRIGNIESREVGAPNQLRVVAHSLLVSVINHEYQHDLWIGEVRSGVHGHDLPPAPTSPHLSVIDGYTVVA